MSTEPNRIVLAGGTLATVGGWGLHTMTGTGHACGFICVFSMAILELVAVGFGVHP